MLFLLKLLFQCEIENKNWHCNYFYVRVHLQPNKKGKSVKYIRCFKENTVEAVPFTKQPNTEFY